LNQAIPRFLGQLGRVVLHAGAVVLRDGPAVLFCGASGRGKSTLVSAYVKAGHELLADDCVALRMESGQVGVYGGTTLVRLRSSDVEAQLGVDSAFGPPDAYSGKRQAPLGRVNDGHSGQDAPLAAVFLLDPPAKRVEVETVPGATALVELLTSVYSLEHREEQQTVGAFQRVGEILESGLPVFRLAYPRSLELLPEVMATVEVTVTKKCARTVTKRRVPPEI
jgi:hypothetical protein